MSTPANNLLIEAATVEESKNSACYFPLPRGLYEVKPGIFPLGFDFGNGELDKQVFQIDGNFAQYREAKLAARAENLSKYYQTHNFSDVRAKAVCQLIINRLIQEYPQYFQLEYLANGGFLLHCKLARETFHLNSDLQLQNPKLDYASTLDALATQVQEDLTAISRHPDDSSWVSAIHLCYPNHWSAQEKIGKDFAMVHAPVAGIEKINVRASALVNMMIFREPMVRFAWGLSTDTRLNHHPETPLNVETTQWLGRYFNPEKPKLYLRIERQVIWGLPEFDTALFTIRTYFRDCAVIKQDPAKRSLLSSAIQSMTPESLVYKGLAETKDRILSWLEDIRDFDPTF